ncbi:hypothetical protein EI94DRAFT_1779862 [Lactarius quietus]|nr:hypothetical protein EI94DRAFT_1779862 [Lactarius quietus]
MPWGQFPIPPVTTTPYLALRCQPALAPFLPDDVGDNSTSLIIVDALVRDQKFLQTSGTVPLNGSTTIPFSLSDLSPRTEPYSLTCTATLSSPDQKFTSIPASLTYLPSPPSNIGSITKIDQRTGGLLVKQAGSQGPYESLFPVGFFTQFDGYLAGNYSVHPIPPYDDITAFNAMVDQMEQLGIWLIYDMRWTYMNATSVTEQVMSIMNRSNLLVPPWAASSTADLINSLDPYRPSSLCLNCQDYLFGDYAFRTPILMPDVYPIGINPNYSVMYDTPCTIEQGCCGCDNCVGDFEDIRDRLEEFSMRLQVLGWDRNATLWDVPQGFGSQQFWSWTPSYSEYLVELIVAVNAGAKGLVAWDAPTTAGIMAGASEFADALPELIPFLLSSPLSSPSVNYAHLVTDNRLDFGLWVSSEGQGCQALILAANLNYFSTSVDLGDVLSATQFQGLALSNPNQIVDGGARIEGTLVTFYGAVLSGGWVFGCG